MAELKRKTDQETPAKRLNDVLNVRIDAALSQEIERIASREGTSASDAARKLLQFGVTVDRHLEADRLLRPYDYQPDPYHAVRAEITARWVSFDPEEYE